MSYPKSKYPIGARWECEHKGRYGSIEFAEMHGEMEIWRYGWSYYDGSRGHFNWTTSYQSARKYIAVYGRFKRVK